jgi:hypothetical protein
MSGLTHTHPSVHRKFCLSSVARAGKKSVITASLTTQKPQGNIAAEAALIDARDST